MAVRDILIVEDQALARMYLCSCVEKCADCRVAGTLNRADAALRRCGDSHIDLILMDICTENDSDGLTAAEEIKKIYPRIKIVMVTSMLEGRFLARARKIGADSFWYKDSPSGDLVGVIEGTLSGKSYWPDSTPAVQLGNTLSCGLSDQELETLRLLCEGQTNAEIANQAKTSRAAIDQIRAIRQVVEAHGMENLPPALQDFIKLRVRHPEATLKELGELASPPLSKSAVYHRVRRIEQLAAELENQNR